MLALTNPTGALNPQDVGRSTFAYSSDGSRLYVMVESITYYNNNKNTLLGGVYFSPSGDVNGPCGPVSGQEGQQLPGGVGDRGSRVA